MMFNSLYNIAWEMQYPVHALGSWRYYFDRRLCRWVAWVDDVFLIDKNERGLIERMKIA